MFGKRLHKPSDGLPHQSTGALQSGRIALLRCLGSIAGRACAPAAFTCGLRVRGVISGDLVAAEDDEVGTCGVDRRFDEFDGVLADVRPVLDVGELQHAEFAGLMELQPTETRGDGKRTIVPLLRWLDARARGFVSMLHFGHSSRVMHFGRHIPILDGGFCDSGKGLPWKEFPR